MQRRLEITSVDQAPEDLSAQVPFTATLLRQLPGDDRPDYWLASVEPPLRWQSSTITHVVLAARLVGASLDARVHDLSINIALVTDASLLDEPRLSFSKCTHVAIGTARELPRRNRVMVFVLAYLAVTVSLLPFALPPLPRSARGVVAAVLVLPPLYLLGEWLAEKADRIPERTLAWKFFKASLYVAVALVVIVFSALCSGTR